LEVDSWVGDIVLIYVQNVDVTMLQWFGWVKAIHGFVKIAISKKRRRKMSDSVIITALICITLVTITVMNNHKKGK